MIKNKDKKLLLVAHGAGLGGADRYVLEQAKLLKNQGYHVECLGFEGGALEALYRQEEIPFSVYMIPQLDHQKIGELVSGHDMVIANTMYAIFFAYEAQKQKPTMLILHDCPSFMEIIFTRTSLACQELKELKHLYGVSKYHVEALQNSGLKKVRILNNFVEDTYSPEYHKEQGEKIKFLTVANWNLVKGYDLAWKAFECLTEEEKNQLEWNIVGQMENELSCVNFLQKAKAEPWVHFHGSISDKSCLHQIYMENDVYLHMSREDSCPLAVVDAAMLQMPMIASKDTGANYLAENGAGWVVDEYDARHVAAVIREALQRRDKLKKMGKAARANYLANATPELYIQALMREIEAVIAEDHVYLQNADGHGKADRNGPEANHKVLKVALYGYNMYAQIEQFYVLKSHLYQLVGIYDRNYEGFRKQGLDVRRPEDLLLVDFDYVCICCVFESTIQAIQKFLIGLGISEEKICIGVNSIIYKSGDDTYD